MGINFPAARKDLESTLANIDNSPDGGTLALKGNFINMVVPTHKNLDSTIKQMSEFILDDFRALLLMLDIVRFLNQRNLDEYRMKFLARALIEHFHSLSRSLLDYLVPAVITGYQTDLNASCDEDQLKKFKSFSSGKDFYGLRQWIFDNKELALKAFGEELVTTISTADWFKNFTTIRNDYSHRGAFLMVKIEAADAFFMFHEFIEAEQPLKHLLDHTLVPRAFYKDKDQGNIGLINFRLYGGLYFARVFSLVESISSCLYSKLGLSGVGYFRDVGVDTVQLWVSDALAAIPVKISKKQAE